MSLEFMADGRVGTVSVTGRVTSAVLLEPLLAIVSEARFVGIEALLVDFSRASALRPCALGAMVELCSRQRPEIRLGFCGLPDAALGRLRRDNLDNCLPIFADLAAARSAPGFADLELAGKRALILCGEPASFLPVDTPGPVALLDILGRPLLGHLLRHLVAEGIRDVVIEPGAFEPELRHAMERHTPTGMSLSVLRHASGQPPCRPESVVAQLAQSGMLPSDDLVVLDGSTMGTVDLRSMMFAHRSSGARITAAVPLLGMPTRADASEIEDEQLAFSEKTVPPVPSAGAFILGAEAVAQASRLGLPGLGSAALDRDSAQRDGVSFHNCACQSRRIETARDLWQEQFQRLEGMQATTHSGGRGATPASDARLDGTVFLGEGVRIATGATVIGPSFIGEGATVAAHASIRRSIVLPGTHVAKGAVLTDCVAGPGGTRSITQNRLLRDTKLSAAPFVARWRADTAVAAGSV